MHPSSIENMKKCRNEFLVLKENIDILDVGGRGLKKANRSYYPIFQDVAKNYFIADIVAGPGVTHVMPEPYVIPMTDNSVDLIVSGQTLEHVKNPFRSVAEMTRVLKPRGYIALIAPSAGPRHDVIDCWRFMDDSFAAIAEECDLETIADWIHQGPSGREYEWRDHIFVGQKK